MYIKLHLLTLLCVTVLTVQCYNILGVFPHPGKSHFDVFQPLMLNLAQRGHNVSVIGYFPRDNKTENYHDIDLSGTSPILLNAIDMDLIINRSRLFKYLGAIPLVHFAIESCATLGSQNIQKLLKSESKFDLIIIEMFTTDCYLGLIHHFKAPFIGVTSSVIMPWMNDRFGNMDNPSYIPVMFMDFSDQMTFRERVENTLMLVLNKYFHWLLYDIPGHETAVKYISQDIPPLADIAKNASLFLVNSHFSLNRPRPLVPSVIEIGGMHIGTLKSLPQVFIL